MRRAQKKAIIEYIETLTKVDEQIKTFIKRNRWKDCVETLEQCQQSAIEVGTAIEKSEGEGTQSVHQLEQYCELIFQAHELILNSIESDHVDTTYVSVSMDTMLHKIEKQLSRIITCISDTIPVRKEIVFLPYKASMWDSLESVWKRVDQDPECDAFVIPIPYFDRKPDGSLGDEHYEGDQYPDYVPITDYNTYDFEVNHPDKIYIHNPYDEQNYVTTVHPFFYSKNIKRFTNDLVYIPYFILKDPNPDDREELESIKHFVTTPGVIHSTHVIVQSLVMRNAYINILVQETGEKYREYWENKILGDGSPKVEKILKTRKEDLDIPDEWLNIIRKRDGHWKKIVFYNTSVGALLQHDTEMVEKIRDTLSIFEKYKDSIALLWRPHPLIEATIKSMKPELWDEYENLVSNYKTSRWGIYDDTSDMDRAVTLCDAYYGDLSSIVYLVRLLNKPIMIQNVEI